MKEADIFLRGNYLTLKLSINLKNEEEKETPVRELQSV